MTEPMQTTRPWRLAGLAILALMPLHVLLRPEGAWALLSTCDLAAIGTGVGLVFGSHRLVGTAFLFQLMIGLPALVLGMFTTYHWNVTGLAVHIVPLVLGGFRVGALGLPRRAWIDAWFVQAASMMIAARFSPPALNIDFGVVVWKPLAATFSLRVFQVLLTLLCGTLLGLGQLVGWLVSSRRARAR